MRYNSAQGRPMRVKKVMRRIRTTKQSLEEIRRANRAYFDALAKRIGKRAAREAELKYLEEIAEELETVTEDEWIEVPMIEVREDKQQDQG